MNKLAGSKYWYYDSGGTITDEYVEYLKRKVNDAIAKSVKCEGDPMKSEDYFVSHALDSSVISPIILFVKDENILFVKSKEIPSEVPNDITNNYSVFDSVQELIDEVEYDYGIEDVKIEFAGMVQTEDSPLFVCTHWNGDFGEEFDVTTHTLSSFDKMELGSTMSALLDCRGYNYFTWANVMMKVFGEIPNLKGE